MTSLWARQVVTLGSLQTDKDLVQITRKDGRVQRNQEDFTTPPR